MTTLRALEPDELPAAHQAIELAFGGDPHPDDEPVELAVMDADKTLGVVEDGRPVATAGWFDFEMTVPGGPIPMAGVTWVSVAPTHRRRGLLRQLMDRQLADLRDLGRHTATLWASEGAIYQRFGYGPASWMLSLEVPHAASFTRAVPVDGLRLDAPSERLLAPVYERVRASRPGWYARDSRWWTYRLHDPAHRRGGSSPLRCLVDGDDGYVLYATKGDWNDAGHDGTVHVRELVARTPESEARLWRYLLDIDLMTRVRAWGQPSDSPLLQLLAEPRKALGRIGDNLWVRPVLLAESLASRRYATEVDVVLGVTDETCPWNAGSWRLAAGPDGATCAKTSDAADLSLDVRDLGAAFLGGTSLVSRARGGWVQQHRPGALAAASVAFGWAGPAPHCPMVF